MAAFRNSCSIAARVILFVCCLMGHGAVSWGDIDSVPLGGVCTRCGSWVPAGQAHGCWAPPSPSRPQPPRRYVNRTEIAQRQKAYDLNKKGNAHFYNGDYEQAVACYVEALKLDPKNPDYLENLEKAQAWARQERERRTREEERRRREAAEAARKRHLEQTMAEIKRVAADLDGLFGRGAAGLPASGLDFVGANDPLFDTGQRPLDTLFGKCAAASPASGLDFVGADDPVYAREQGSSSMVDLRFIGPDEPLIIDPRVVKGEMSPEAARKDRNDRARKALDGYAEAVAKDDIGLAVRHLEEALGATPYDRAIREAYAVALKLRDERARQHKMNRKVTVLLDALEYGKSNWHVSLLYLKKRHEAEPDDPFVRDAFYFIAGVSDDITVTLLERNSGTQEIDDETHALMANAITSSMRGRYQEAFNAFSQAHAKYPQNQAVRDILNFTEGQLAAQRAQAAGIAVHNKKGK